MQRSLHFFKFHFTVLIAIWVLIACGNHEQILTPSGIPSPSITLTFTATPTVEPPTPTPIPLAARVNGEGITLAEFQAELARFQAVRQASEDAGMDEQSVVLEDIIDQVLLAQGARQAGFVFGPNDLHTRIQNLSEEIGGEDALASWMTGNGYDMDSFQKALARSSAAAWMRDEILSAVPETAEQLHARQIFLYNADEADQVLAELDAGKDFATLAAAYDPVGSGDLGWFPRGYLTDPKLEEAAFSLQPGEYSRVIETTLGFHVLQVIEREPERRLDPEARLNWQEKALRDWLESRRDESQIEILLP